MQTLVFFHAHPDDEAIATAGSMIEAIEQGHRVVLVTATNGELGLAVPGVADQGAELGAHRRAELMRAADVIGVHRVVTLDFHDSGMAGDPSNEAPVAFCQQDVDRAAEVLAAILTEESATVLTVYDKDGSYGHPDHIAVHRVGVRAAEMAGVSRVFESTICRDAIVELMAAAAALQAESGDSQDDEGSLTAEVEGPDLDMVTVGQPLNLITHAIPVSRHIERKRKAMLTHESQIGPDSWFVKLDADMFSRSFGQEWYILRGLEPQAEKLTSLWDGLV